MNSELHRNQHSDEIDLIDLIKALWKEKIKIALVTGGFTLLAGIYAFTAKEQWTSQAEVIAPQLSDVESYLKVRNEYNRILGSDPIDATALKNGLFDTFNRLMYSLDERETFFKDSAVYKRLIEGKDEKGQHQVLTDLINTIKVVKPDEKKEPALIGRRVSLSLETPTEAQDMLKGLINHINQSAYRLELDNFLISFQEKLDSLNYESKRIEQDLLINKDVTLKHLDKAIKISDKAGLKDNDPLNSKKREATSSIMIDNTQVVLSDNKLSDSSYLSMFGDKYLKAQIDAVKSNTIYPTKYYEIQEQLKQLEPLLTKTKSVKAQAYSYQSSPDYPITKDKPKKVLILLIGLVVGLVLSSLSVLVIDVVKKHNKGKA